MLLLALAVCVAGGATASEPRGIQTAQQSFSFSVAVPCLSEVLEQNVLVDVRYHVFETGAGSIHVIDNWRLYYFVVGLSSGRTWLGEGVSPYQLNTKVEKGVVEQWISRIRLTPQDEGSPTILYSNQFRVTLNANGDLVVVHEEEPLGDSFRCLPNVR